MKRLFPSCLIALLLFCGVSGRAQEPFALKPHDTVVFYGDSITDQRMYTLLTELYVVTRYPKLDVNFVHSGWGGDRVTGGGGGGIDVRLARDVVTYHPTVMTIMLGMNDGDYLKHTEASDTTYYAGYHHIIDSVEKSIPNLRITVIGPSPYDDVTRPAVLKPDGYNAVMVRYSEFLKKYAREAKLGYADLNTDVVAMLQKANASDPAVAQKIIPDRVHPGWGGHLIMSEQLLKAWHARAVVSSVTIDAAGRKVSGSEFARVTELRTSGPLKWTQTDEALPMPFVAMLGGDNDKSLALAIRSSDVTEALNEEPLKVTGLAAGSYKLNIDGMTVGTYSEAELAQGINLATLDTPMEKQAATVRDLTTKRIDVHQVRWRTLQVPMTPLDLLHLDEAMKGLDTLDAELTAKQREAAQPLPHDFELVSFAP
jgi:lysophospholipase L1-like esterase